MENFIPIIKVRKNSPNTENYGLIALESNNEASEAKDYGKWITKYQKYIS